jgi:hypothetical protein
MRKFLRVLFSPFTVPAHHCFWGGLLITLFTSWVVVDQVGNRWNFAGGELRQDVMARWGAPIDQPAPSARFVESGAVFSTLEALPFDSQQLKLSAKMSYRKRGLVHFSGFEFGFDGRYRLTNPRSKPIDAVFVFPIQADQNRILLSDLAFTVDGKAESIPLHSRRDKLVWTGRIEPRSTVTFGIRLRGQGLDRFRYLLDPAMSARNVDLQIDVEGGDNFDYPPAVVPAHSIEQDDGHVKLIWHFDSLESGVPVGLLLPSETSFDSVITTMARRAWAPFVVLFAITVMLARYRGQPMARQDAYFLAAIYSFFFILLPYLAAYMNFYVAWLISVALIGSLLDICLQRITAAGRVVSGGLIGALLVLPTTAVIFEQHTGLIYCLEILAGLALLTVLMGKPRFRQVVEELTRMPPPASTEVTPSEHTLPAEGENHASA